MFSPKYSKLGDPYFQLIYPPQISLLCVSSSAYPLFSPMASQPIPHLLLTLFLTLGTLTNLSQSRPIVSFHSKTGLLSDGINNVNYTNSFPLLLPKNGWVFASESCEQTYGFLPCTTTVFGNLFLILVYGYLMFTAATFLSNGSEMLLEILGPGIIGGLFLPVLGALPDALLILVSGLSGSKETAQSQVLVGMGLLAGSTVMLLTLLWGSCIIVGKCDLEDSHAVDQKNTKGFSFTGSGVSTDIWTTYAAMIMAVSVIPFVIVQLPQIFLTSSGKRVVVLIALIAAVTLLLSYCIYQVFQPWIQERKLAFAKHKLIMSGILKHLKQHALGRLFTDAGEPNTDVIRKLFKAIDENSDERLSPAELRALVLGIRFEEIDLDQEDAVAKVLKDFDTSGDSFVDEEEFVVGISKWLREAKRTVVSNAGAESAKFMHEYHQQTKKEHDLLGNHGDDGAESIQDPKWTTIKAVLMLMLGTAVAAAFADPLVDAVDNFSSATSIPSFFISFIVLPFATNTSEAVSAIIFASRKKRRTASLTFSEIYGAVTMNNLLCLAVFLALVYVRHLTWDFSAEVLIILIVCIVMGVFGSLRTTFPLWTCSIAYALYPLSLVLVYVLDYVFGWS